MSEKKAYVQLKTIKPAADGEDYLKMMVPVGWKVSFSRNDRYCGYGYPFGFSVSFISPDNSTMIKYNSPFNYIDDFLHPDGDNSQDPYGRLHYHFQTLEEFADTRIAENLYDCRDMAFLNQRDFKDIDHMQQQKELETRKLFERSYPNRFLDWRYYKAAIREYRYNQGHYKRVRACSVLIDGTLYRQYLPMPNQQQRLQNTEFSRLQAEYPGLSLDEQSNTYMYLAEHLATWNAKNFFILDAPIEDYAAVYRNYFMPIISKGVILGNALIEEFRQQQQIINARNETLRRQMRKRLDEEFKNKVQQEQENHTFFESVNSENQNNASDLSKMDGFFARNAGNRPDNRRFRDSQGNIHTVATNGTYAYLKNGKIFTSRTDIKLELGTMWEQLTPVD